MTQTTSDVNNLYDRDFVAWCEDTVIKLKARQLDALDLEHLIEEIAGLAGRDKRELQSRLIVLLAHLLKRIYVNSSHDYRGWENTIREQRQELELLLKQSPSLRNYLAEVFDQSWQYALKNVRANYPQVQFPDAWPFSRTVENLLTETFWQSANNE
jgi:vacuolar-type H+-ATPase catalytic subunit A/Vma1